MWWHDHISRLTVYNSKDARSTIFPETEQKPSGSPRPAGGLTSCSSSRTSLRRTIPGRNARRGPAGGRGRPVHPNGLRHAPFCSPCRASFLTGAYTASISTGSRITLPIPTPEPQPETAFHRTGAVRKRLHLQAVRQVALGRTRQAGCIQGDQPESDYRDTEGEAGPARKRRTSRPATECPQ